MCVVPNIGPTTQPKPAAQQTSEGIQQASPAVWQMLAEKGGTMGAIARQKLTELNAASAKAAPSGAKPYPAIPSK